MSRFPEIDGLNRRDAIYALNMANVNLSSVKPEFRPELLERMMALRDRILLLTPSRKRGKQSAMATKSKRITQKDVKAAAASYQNMLVAYGEHNMATQRAEWSYRELQRRYDLQRSEREFVKAFSENKYGELM